MAGLGNVDVRASGIQIILIVYRVTEMERCEFFNQINIRCTVKESCDGYSWRHRENMTCVEYCRLILLRPLTN